MRRLASLIGSTLVVAASLVGLSAPAQADQAVDTGVCEVSVRDRTPGVYPGGFYVYTDCVQLPSGF